MVTLCDYLRRKTMSQNEHKKAFLNFETDSKRDIRKKETSIIKKDYEVLHDTSSNCSNWRESLLGNYINGEVKPVE